MSTRYVAEFKISDITGVEEQEDVSKGKEPNEIVNKERKFEAKTVAKGVSLATGVAIVGASIYQQLERTSNSITGDNVAQMRLDNKMSLVNEGLGLVGTFGVAGLIGGATGVVTAAVATAIKYGNEAFQTAQKNQVKQANWNIELKVNAEKQRKLVQNITGGRL